MGCEFQQSVVCDAIDQRRKRLEACIRAEGGQSYRTLQYQSINQSINVKFVGRRYTTLPGAATVVNGKHDYKVHS